MKEKDHVFDDLIGKTYSPQEEDVLTGIGKFTTSKGISQSKIPWSTYFLVKIQRMFDSYYIEYQFYVTVDDDSKIVRITPWHTYQHDRKHTRKKYTTKFDLQIMKAAIEKGIINKFSVSAIA